MARDAPDQLIFGPPLDGVPCVGRGIIAHRDHMPLAIFALIEFDKAVRIDDTLAIASFKEEGNDIAFLIVVPGMLPFFIEDLIRHPQG